MIERISSGIATLDAALDGGYPRGSVISFLGNTSSLRKRLVFSFLEAVDIATCLYINTRDTPEMVLHEAELYKSNLDNLVFLDAVHWRSKRFNPKEESSAQYQVSNLTDLNGLLAKIMEACNSQEITRVLFDSPSSLLLYTTPGKEQVYKFFELLTAFVRSKKITLCYTLEEKVHPGEVIATMHYLSDGVIECLEPANGTTKGSYRIVQMSLTNYHQDRIELPNQET